MAIVGHEYQPANSFSGTRFFLVSPSYLRWRILGEQDWWIRLGGSREPVGCPDTLIQPVHQNLQHALLLGRQVNYEDDITHEFRLPVGWRRDWSWIGTTKQR